MSTASLIHRLSPQEYLDLERDAAQRHEYLDGEAVAMAGGSRAHNLLMTRVARLLGNHLDGSPCRLYQSDMKVRVERANRFYYPDVMVCCDPLEPDADDDYETAPKLIIEVLSPNTAANDDGEKRVNYQTLNSLEEYLLVDPQSSVALLYRRKGAFWTRITITLEDELELECIGYRKPLTEVLGEL
jgi:Uma2 family endonuclease